MTLKKAFKELAERDPRFHFYEGGYKNGGTVGWKIGNEPYPRICSIVSLSFESAQEIAHMLDADFQILRANHDQQIVHSFWIAEWWMTEDKAVRRLEDSYETSADAIQHILVAILSNRKTK